MIPLPEHYSRKQLSVSTDAEDAAGEDLALLTGLSLATAPLNCSGLWATLAAGCKLVGPCRSADRAAAGETVALESSADAGDSDVTCEEPTTRRRRRRLLAVAVKVRQSLSLIEIFSAVDVTV